MKKMCQFNTWVKYSFHIQDEKLTAFWLHRQDADADYVNTLIREVDDPTVLLVVAVGDVKTGGQLTLCGSEPLLKQLSPK